MFGLNPNMADRLSNIKTNIVTGFLGAGKSTAILNLMQQKPRSESWAILVNEFGEIGIDGGLLSSNVESGVFIREVPGGCMCCAAGLPMQIAMNMLLARAKPQRLIIEPTGLGHPFEVMSILAADHYRELLDLRTTIAMVDARKVKDSRYTKHDTFNQQLEIADLIIASKNDLYDSSDFANLHSYLSSSALLPERKLVAASRGNLELEWLDGPASAWRLNKNKIHTSTELALDAPEPETEFPAEGFIRMSNRGEGFESYGWLFESTFIFESNEVSALLERTKVDRLKALFITSTVNIGFNYAGDDLEELTLRDLPDSRIEIISSTGFDADAFEENLLKTCSR
ncbi:MAG: G3E family GTPase [Dinoroseobacter sp.]|jgi:G3E family GTPase